MAKSAKVLRRKRIDLEGSHLPAVSGHRQVHREGRKDSQIDRLDVQDR